MVQYMNLEEQADRGFTRARRRAFLRRMRARLRNDLACNRLLPFDEAKVSLGAFTKVYLGMRVVPVEKIVGSVNRYRDFDRTFPPTGANLETRRKRIDRAYRHSEELPPASLYKIGDKCFVLDGDRCVSVARYQGVETIDAEAVEIRSRIPIGQMLQRERKET